MKRMAFGPTRDATKDKSGATVTEPTELLRDCTSSGCTWASPFRSDQTKQTGFRPGSLLALAALVQSAAKVSDFNSFQSCARPNAATGRAMWFTSCQTVATPGPPVGLPLWSLEKYFLPCT